MRWVHTPFAPEAVEELSRTAGVSPVLAELLLRAGLTRAEDAAGFLRPELPGLGDPFLLHNLEAAAGRLRQAIARGESIAVLGDYDVDGVSSTALLVAVLRRFGLDPRFIVPRRSEDGYGLSRSAIDRALEPGRPDLFIALDCGTNSHDEVAYLRAQGIEVIVVDHHRSKERPLEGGLLVNPHVSGLEACRHLCTAGLVFKLLHGLLKQLRGERHEIALGIKLRDHLDLVALGTIADLVPLTGENRILARHGLRILQTTSRPGLRALMEVAGLRTGQDVLPEDVSFRLGPRINASGRLADAALSVELLLSEDEEFCAATARRLDGFNRERQAIERRMTDAAERLIEGRFSDDAGIVLFDEGWHPGVVGIVAGRVTRKYHRPCIVLGNEGDLAKGSGRSVEGADLVEILASCSEHLESWGGHPMAVGVSLPKSRLEEFRCRFTEVVRRQAGAVLGEARLDIAAWLRPERVGEELLGEIDALHPFGQGNPEPIFALAGIELDRPPEVFKEQHFRFSFGDARGRRLRVVAWKMARRMPPARTRIDLAVQLHWNHFNGRKLLQLELVDWRPAA